MDKNYRGAQHILPLLQLGVVFFLMMPCGLKFHSCYEIIYNTGQTVFKTFGLNPSVFSQILLCSGCYSIFQLTGLLPKVFVFSDIILGILSTLQMNEDKSWFTWSKVAPKWHCFGDGTRFFFTVISNFYWSYVWKWGGYHVCQGCVVCARTDAPEHACSVDLWIVGSWHTPEEIGFGES